ncbi:hypothetical protein PACTADRAFT_51147 [Pachysolen tannophilus NRRL Y-2460]|uniref:tRNA-splicing endonuclease subunit Sen34 n=1 Tax=Pachysolen tannophilus NRRL Y-2460 TaxID=669874 RepID=A0A1E4TRC3_PACTA|nr:hypothetical protein PACTADRAFT_51147 [Pachysolen tannophilus NRRL Y-2460]
MEEEKVAITVIGDRALIFSLDDVKRLRDLKVTGVLSGTLPIATQQNIFLGLPLQLMSEEVVYLVLNRYGYLVPSKFFYNNLLSSSTDGDLEKFLELKNEIFQSQTKQKELDNLVKQKNLVNNNNNNGNGNSHLVLHKGSNNESTFFYEIDNQSLKSYPSYKSFQKYYDKSDIQLKLLNEFFMKNGGDLLMANCNMFSYLLSKNYYIAPGLKFGGNFIAYPGDPLNYHSHLIVNVIQDFYTDDIGLNRIVNGGRLATSVKKIWTIGGNKNGNKSYKDLRFPPNNETLHQQQQQDLVCFSIEWSGFG